MLSYLNLLRISNLLLTAMSNKLNRAYKTIGEVTELLNLKNKSNGKLNTHVLRYWEKEFKQIKPKLISNRRFYDKNTVDLLMQIKFLLKEQGMTIKGVKKALNNKRFDLDGSLNEPINISGNNLKMKLNKISNIIKNLKK